MKEEKTIKTVLRNEPHCTLLMFLKWCLLPRSLAQTWAMSISYEMSQQTVTCLCNCNLELFLLSPNFGGFSPESIQWFIEDQSFLRSYNFAPPPVSKLSRLVSLPVFRGLKLLRERGGRGRSQIKRPGESLVIYKSFNTPWFASSLTLQLALHRFRTFC